MIIEVGNSAALATALKSLHDGDTIQLDAGEYTLSKLQNLSFATGVTITSADPTHEAVLDGVNMQNVSGLTLSGLEIKVDDTVGMAVNLNGGSNDHFINLNAHGTAVGDGKGLQIRSATNVTLDHLDIHNVQVGVGLITDTGVVVTNSSIHDLQIDGIQSLGTSNVTISGNNFTNFFPKAGDHSDAIQFITAGTTTTTHDVTITDNTYIRGAGFADTQGIFLGNEAKIPYENVTITNNAVVGGIYQGIMVSYADQVNVSGNTVEGYTDITSWINVNETTHATVSNNVSTSYLLVTANVGMVSVGNTTIPQSAVGDTSILHPANTSEPIAPITPTPVVFHLFDGGSEF